MTNRSAAIRHVRFTRRSRERHANADQNPPRAYPERVQTPTLPQATGQEALPLAGFYRLYEAQLRAERKSPKTIRIYFDGLGKFRDWLEASYGRPAALADLNVVEARLFLADALERQKVSGSPHPGGHDAGDAFGQHDPPVHARPQDLRRLGGARGLHVDPPAAYPAPPRLEERQLRPLSEEEERRLLGAYDDNNPVECRLKAIFLLMLDTGIRCGELMSLTLANLNLDGGCLLVMGKGRKERSIPFGFTTERLSPLTGPVQHPGQVLDLSGERDYPVVVLAELDEQHLRPGARVVVAPDVLGYGDLSLCWSSFRSLWSLPGFLPREYE